MGSRKTQEQGWVRLKEEEARAPCPKQVATRKAECGLSARSGLTRIVSDHKTRKHLTGILLLETGPLQVEKGLCHYHLH